ncbi:hypothetical protein EP47_08220 [Legionella norrlandica]|uniref:BioF2-like acetyltransferase domain-containing protein n=1 Tax=Legionella norrlandica TaxID=1498499 RepID=A0A0A2SWK5_9GAMM|nr:hypothetical protein [Legionella norrlandica]KGP64116.1 hypothetical protein EP47_08220 [Legionella norrlandica]
MIFNDKCTLYSNPFIHGSSKEWMLNVETRMTTEEMGGFLFPATLNDTEYHSSYVCSPYNALITYSKDELFKINNRLLRFCLILLINSIGGLLRLGKVNKNYFINNFLLSTNPYPNWHGDGVKEQLNRAREKYPQHAIMYRSLNEHTNKNLIEHLKKEGFILAASRQVYIFDANLQEFINRNNTQNDRRALAKSEYELVLHDQIKESDYHDIVRLYNLLYLEKYSKHNPQFSLKLIAYWHQNRLLTLMGLRDKHGILQGIVGLFESEQVITAPLVGYNTKLSKDKSLYRILIYLVLDYSHKKNRCLNLSSGASHFKLLRGGQPFIEYTAAYIKHLPLYRRITWRAIQILLNVVFVPLLKRYKL